MNNDFILVHKSIAPAYYELVISARNKIEGENKPVSLVCKEMGISRSTYYKYKDLVDYPKEETAKKAILSFKVDDVPGVLSQILSCVYKLKSNVLAINQEVPIRNIAYITLMISLDKLSLSLDNFINQFRKIEHVLSVEVLSHE